MQVKAAVVELCHLRAKERHDCSMYVSLGNLLFDVAEMDEGSEIVFRKGCRGNPYGDGEGLDGDEQTAAPEVRKIEGMRGIYLKGRESERNGSVRIR